MKILSVDRDSPDDLVVSMTSNELVDLLGHESADDIPGGIRAGLQIQPARIRRAARLIRRLRTFAAENSQRIADHRAALDQLEGGLNLDPDPEEPGNA